MLELMQIPIDPGAGGMDLGTYKVLFGFALVLVAVISVFLILGLNKAKQDEEKRMKMTEKQTALMAEIVDILKELRASHKNPGKTDSAGEPEKKAEA